jgi:hypothetical protein
MNYFYLTGFLVVARSKCSNTSSSVVLDKVRGTLEPLTKRTHIIQYINFFSSKESYIYGFQVKKNVLSPS